MPSPPAAGDAPHARVNAGQLEHAILALRRPLLEAPLLLDAPGVTQARAERRKLLSQIDDYLLPRLRESGAPILVALVGSTGAGKSTLVNSLVGAQVSATGIRRPTTNSPVLACHPDDVDWFAENVFLPTVPRVRQEGLARSGRDGLLVLAASEGMPKGIALLDTPDIDSVVQEHRAFAHQFLDASDLWLFMTTSSRYADAAVWELLQQARDRRAALAVVLSRVSPAAAGQLTDHFAAMLAANGLGEKQQFVIHETVITEGRLPAEASGPLREWLETTAAGTDRRVAILTETMSGVLDTFLNRVPALAAHVETQLALRSELRSAVEGAYAAALAGIDGALGDGSLLRGEILARWQDFAGTGDLLRSLQARKGGTAARRQGREDAHTRAHALRRSLRAALESLVSSVADRAAEDCVQAWREQPAGAALLDWLASGGHPGEWQGSQFAADAGLLLHSVPAWSITGGRAGGLGGFAEDGPIDPAALARSSPDLARRAGQAVSGWQDQVLRLVQAENVTKRSIARAISFDDEALATVLMVGLLGQEAGDAAPDAAIGSVPQRLLTSLFGAGPLRDVSARARADLRTRVSLLLDEEMLRFSAALDASGVPDATAAVRLYQATYLLEVAR